MKIQSFKAFKLSVSLLSFYSYLLAYYLSHMSSSTQGKLQKHQAFEAEVQANAGAIIKLDETGNLMISEGHFASETIRVRHTVMKMQSV